MGTKPFFLPADAEAIFLNIAMPQGASCKIHVSAADGTWESELAYLTQPHDGAEVCVDIGGQMQINFKTRVQLRFRLQGPVRIYAFTLVPGVCGKQHGSKT